MTTEARLTLGELLTSTITLLVEGVATDPGSLSLKYRRFGDPTTEVVIDAPDPLNPPAGIVRLDVGIYKATILLDEVGDWRVRWESTSPAQSAVERRVIVSTLYP